MKYNTKQLNIYYAQVFLNAFTSEDMPEDMPEVEQFQYIQKRFISEYNWNIQRKGVPAAFTEWLQGLAISIPFTNYEILEMAKETGHYQSQDKISNELTEYEILDTYWNFMTNKFFWLLDRKQAWFDTNLPKKG